MSSRYGKKLQILEAKGRLRSLHPLKRRDEGRVEYNGRSLLNLSSNDYLGLGQDIDLRNRFYQGLEEEQDGSFGLAAASSRLLTGDSLLAHDLENDIATAYGTEAVLLFNSGYHANIGILPALYGKGDLILSDKLNHASIHDGLSLSRADHKRFRHCDYEQLHGLLKKYRKQYDQVVIVSESVFSMDGDIADIAHLVDLKKEFNAILYLDEAHAVGVYGRKGLGKAEQLGFVQDIDFLVGTFGKALASIGAFICCSKEIRSFLINHSRSFIFTTGLPPVSLNWNRFVFQHMQGMKKEREHLEQISTQLRLALADNGLLTGGHTNIIPVLIGDDTLALEQSKSMQELGFLILPVRPPTVPEGTARFRLSLCANMQWQDLQEIPGLLAGLADGAQGEN
ncbi:MAG: 8-amino-7-oxononanoate synthase [Thermodesulfobacteriota bacterium]|nr:8-amino-7-oxononanoate synthase [Thermodesulfobacteriota bacterium]